MREAEFARVEQAIATGDFDVGNMTVGQSVGLVRDVPKAPDLIDRVIAEAGWRYSWFCRARRQVYWLI